MAEGPPPLENGYVWVARVALPLPKVHDLARNSADFAMS